MKRFLLIIAAGYFSLVVLLFAVPHLRRSRGTAAGGSGPAGLQNSGSAQGAVKKNAASRPGALRDSGEISGKPSEPKSVRTLYKNGGVSSVWIFRDGQLSGECLVYYPNGNIWLELPFSSGKENGLVKRFDDAGRPVSQTPYRDGLADGKARFFYPSGGLWFEQVYSQGTPSGLPVVYSENLSAPVTRSDAAGVEKDKPFRLEAYYAAKTKSGEWNGKGDRLAGTARLFHPEGAVFMQVPYAEGVPDGEEFVYDAAGRLRMRTGYVSGLRQGSGQIYYEDGSVLADFTYQNGKPAGTPRFYSEGRIQSESTP